MKILYLLTFLFFIMTGFSQPAKDSLLAKDHQQVNDVLGLVCYLDRCASTLESKSKEELATIYFLKYYKDIILKNNKVENIDINQYLGYLNSTEPANTREFCNNVYSKNIETIIKITNKYGYPSRARMISGGYTKQNYASMYYITRSNDYDKQLKLIFKDEHKVGNIPDQEYYHFKFIIKRKRIMTDNDIEWLEKKAGIKIRYN